MVSGRPRAHDSRRPCSRFLPSPSDSVRQPTAQRPTEGAAKGREDVKVALPRRNLPKRHQVFAPRSGLPSHHWGRAADEPVMYTATRVVIPEPPEPETILPSMTCQ